MSLLISNIFRCDDAKVIEVFLENPDEELTTADIIIITNIKERPAILCLRNLVENDIIKRFIKSKKIKYKFNSSSENSKALFLLEHMLVTKALDKAIKEQS